MKILSLAVFALLTAIAVLHVAWGFGLRWPAASERELVATVIGAKGRTRMPGLAECLVAAAAIFCAGCIALLSSGLVTPLLPQRVLTIGGFVWFGVFTLRGVAAYLPAWRNVFSQQPFARYDQLYYAPFCLFVALVFALLLAERLRG
jgi:hypothetical protein